MERFDAPVVVGAGVLGRGRRCILRGESPIVLLLLDAYGPGKARASSAWLIADYSNGGYGADEIYTR